MAPTSAVVAVHVVPACELVSAVKTCEKLSVTGTDEDETDCDDLLEVGGKECAVDVGTCCLTVRSSVVMPPHHTSHNVTIMNTSCHVDSPPGTVGGLHVATNTAITAGVSVSHALSVNSLSKTGCKKAVSGMVATTVVRFASSRSVLGPMLVSHSAPSSTGAVSGGADSRAHMTTSERRSLCSAGCHLGHHHIASTVV